MFTDGNRKVIKTTRKQIIYALLHREPLALGRLSFFVDIFYGLVSNFWRLAFFVKNKL